MIVAVAAVILALARLCTARFEHLALLWAVGTIPVTAPEDGFADVELSVVVVYAQSGAEHVQYFQMRITQVGVPSSISVAPFSTYPSLISILQIVKWLKP